MFKITPELFKTVAHTCEGFLNATQSPGGDRKLTREEADRGVVLGARNLELRLGLPEKSITTETNIDAEGDFAGGKWRYSGDRADDILEYEYQFAFGEVGVDVVED